MTGETLFDIGYERSVQASVFAALTEAGVRTVIDIRARPQSRKPGFSRRQLEAGLVEAGLRYVHLRDLGTPAEGREANRLRQWDRFWAIVEEGLSTAEAELALHQAGDIAAKSPSALLCFEADWHICHRKRVGEMLQQRHGFILRHLSPVGATDQS